MMVQAVDQNTPSAFPEAGLAQQKHSLTSIYMCVCCMCNDRELRATAEVLAES